MPYYGTNTTSLGATPEEQQAYLANKYGQLQAGSWPAEPIKQEVRDYCAAEGIQVPDWAKAKSNLLKYGAIAAGAYLVYKSVVS